MITSCWMNLPKILFEVLKKIIRKTFEIYMEARRQQSRCVTAASAATLLFFFFFSFNWDHSGVSFARLIRDEVDAAALVFMLCRGLCCQPLCGAAVPTNARHLVNKEVWKLKPSLLLVQRPHCVAVTVVHRHRSLIAAFVLGSFG